MEKETTLLTKQYRNLGKLIDMEHYYIPCLEFLDSEALGLNEAQAKRMEFEELKEHTKTYQDGGR